MESSRARRENFVSHRRELLRLTTNFATDSRNWFDTRDKELCLERLSPNHVTAALTSELLGFGRDYDLSFLLATIWAFPETP